jgi:hypothetical protein
MINDYLDIGLVLLIGSEVILHIWILTKGGCVIARSTVQHVTTTELQQTMI